MKTLGFLSKIKKMTALILMGYFAVLSPATLLAQVSQPVSAPITVPVPIPAPTSTPSPIPSSSPAIPAAPELIYPQNGQTLDLEGAYMFKVKQIPGAQGYLFGFFQNGVMIYENWRDIRQLSSNGEFAIWPNDPAHNKFKAGPVQVWVRAWINNRWTDAREIVIHLKPRTPIATPAPKSDLTVSSTATVGQPNNSGYAYITLTNVVKNIGSASAQPSVLQINIKNSNQYWRLQTNALAAGASQTLTISTYKSAGSYQFVVRADVDSQIAESNENNNSATNIVIVPVLNISPIVPIINSSWPANLRLGRWFVISGKNFGNLGMVNFYRPGQTRISGRAITYYWSNSLVVGLVPSSGYLPGNETYGIQVQPEGFSITNSPLIYRYISR